MKAKRILFPPLALLLTCLYPCAFQYLRNAQEAKPRDMLPMLGLFLAMGAAALLLSLIFLRDFPKAGLFASLTMLAAVNSGLLGQLLKRLIPMFRDRYTIGGLLVLLLAFLLLLKKKKVPATELCQILTILFAALTLIQAVPAAPTLWKQLTFHRPENTIDEDSVVFQGEKPNVYCFLVDEYGGTENLRRYYNFDNREFLDFLRERQFNISDTSKNTESVWTMVLMPNLLNLDYVVEEDTENKAAYMEDNALTELFQENDYQVNVIDHIDFIGTDDCRLLSSRPMPDSISTYIFRNSVLGQIPWMRHHMNRFLGVQSDISRGEQMQEDFSLMEHCTDYVKPGTPTLTIAYVQCPHYPFLFRRDGTLAPRKTSFEDDSLYLDQLGYLNDVLERSIENILEKDPDAVILLESDHGSRRPVQRQVYHGGPDYDPVAETPYMQNALNCVYLGGRRLDIEGLSGINTLRSVLNAQFGTGLALLEQPEGYTCYGKDWQDLPDWIWK